MIVVLMMLVLSLVDDGVMVLFFIYVMNLYEYIRYRVHAI